MPGTDNFFQLFLMIRKNKFMAPERVTPHWSVAIIFPTSKLLGRDRTWTGIKPALFFLLCYVWISGSYSYYLNSLLMDDSFLPFIFFSHPRFLFSHFSILLQSPPNNPLLIFIIKATFIGVIVFITS